MKPQTESRWYEGITRPQWMVLLIASLGWVFDVFEGQLYNTLKTPAVTAVMGPGASPDDVKSITGLTITCFLAGGALGGAVFGVLADRIGRRKVMIMTILLYSIFTALTAFARTWQELAVLRFLVALGVAGEWAVGAALVSEVFPERARTAASGLFHASSGIGVFLAAIVGMTIGATDWRAAFLLGLVPALLTLGVRAGVQEPERWTRVQGIESRGNLRELFTDPVLRRHTLAAAGLATVGLAGLWSTAFWAPELAREVLKGSGMTDETELRRLAGQAMLLMNIGNTAGLLCFAPLTARWGRRRTFLAYHVGVLLMAPIAFLGARDYAQAVVALGFLGFAAVGMHAGYAIYFPELFPTRLRATGAGFCFNVGRIVAAPGPWLMTLLSQQVGGLRVAAVIASSVYLLGIACLAFTPETADQPLPE